jgi:ATP-dependent Clp protease ATP-binding subunit ClpC
VRPTYSHGVHRILANAQEEAGKYRHRFVHTEYLLLGLLHERNSATGLLKSLGFERERLRKACERRCKRGEHVMEGEIKLTPRVQHIMALAAEQMQTMGHAKLDSRHILLGILLEEEGAAGEVLRQSGVTEDVVRAAILTPKAAGEAEQEEFSERRERKPFWKKLLRA